MAEDGAGRTVCVYLENACGHLLAFSDELITVARELKKRYGFTISGLALCSGNALKNLLREVQQLSFERIDIYIGDAFEYFEDGNYLEGICEYYDSHRPDLILAPNTVHSKTVLSQLASRKRLGMCADCVEICQHGEQIVATRPVYEGNTYADICATGSTLVCTIRKNIFDPHPRNSDVAANICIHPCEAAGINSEWLLSVSNRHFAGTESNQIMIGVGAGLRRKEDLDQIRQMADLIHADIGVTRALVEKGWAPKEYQIGLSGRAVQPELYIALGISGASQHLIGLRKCKNIIAVNRDANATVFQYATVGIVADFYDVLPRLSQMILNRRKDG